MANTLNQHQVAEGGVELRGFGYRKSATVAALPVTGQPGEILTVTATGVDYQWNHVLGTWVPWHNSGTVLQQDIAGTAAVNVSGRSAVELRLTGNVSSLTVNGWDADTTRTQRVRFRVRQDSTGGRSFAWNQVTGTWVETPRTNPSTAAGVTSYQWYAVTTDGGVTVWLEPIGVGLDCLWMQVSDKILPGVAAGGSVTVAHPYSMVASVDLIDQGNGRRVLADWAHTTPTDPASPVRIEFSAAHTAGTYKARIAGLASTPCGVFAAATDATPPAVTAVSPANGATGVVGGSVEVTFSEPVLDNGAVQLLNGVTVVPVTVFTVANIVTLTPTVPLASTTTYTVSVGTGVTDLSGNHATASSTTFTTADTVAPTVVSISPTAGATDVSQSTTINVTFSEPVVPNGGITLSIDGGASVPATVSVTGNTVTLTPTATLADTTTYRVDISTAVTDTSGNALVAPATSTFQTPVWTSTTLSFTGTTTATTTLVWTGGAGTVQWVYPDNTTATPVSGAALTKNFGVSTSGNMVLRWRTGTVITSFSDSATRWTFNVSALPSTLTTLQLLAGTMAVTGNVSGLPAGLTSCFIQGVNTLTGDLANTPRPLTNLRVTGSNTISGNLSGLPAGLTQLLLSGSNTVTGNLSSLPTGLTLFSVSGSNTISGNLSSLPPSLGILLIAGANTVSGTIQSIPSTMTSFDIQGNNTVTGDIGLITATGLTTFQLLGASGVTGASTPLPFTSVLKQFRLKGTTAGLSQAGVDAVLAKIDSFATTGNGIAISGVGSAAAGGDVNLAGLNAAPSAAGVTSKSNLQGRSWTVATN